MKVKLIEHGDLRESRLLDRAEVERQELELVIIASSSGAATLRKLLADAVAYCDEYGWRQRENFDDYRGPTELELAVMRAFGVFE